jgi:hypothetical protein
MTQLGALRAGVALLPILRETKDCLPRNSEAVAKITPEELETIIAALEAASTDGEGWVRVPREPTKKMLESGGAIFWQHILPEGKPPQIDPFVWKAMIAASPLSPAPASKGEKT